MNHRTMARLSALALLLLLHVAGPAYAEDYLTTAFVPEWTTLTVQGSFLFHADEIKDVALDRTGLGVGVSYVLYPGLQGLFDVGYFDYDSKIAQGEGLGLSLGFKYQLPSLIEGADLALLLRGTFQALDNFTESDLTLAGIISRDIAAGWTPFASLGLAVNKQELSSSLTHPALEEQRILPVISGGLKYSLKSHLGASAGAFYKDGVGVQGSLVYRF